MTDAPLLTMKAVTKRYGGVPAIDSVDFDLRPGEVHALVGENGAGKSTLCKIIAGVLKDYEGDLEIDGAVVSMKTPRDAYEKGISMVFQETSLVPQLTVAQNLVLGREKTFNSVWALRNEARQLLRSLNFNIDPDARAGALNTARRQMVEIARAVNNQSRIIILDEPTAALTPEETDHFFFLVNELRGRGVSMIFISHALEEALTQADRITVLRNGLKIVTDDASAFDRAKLIGHMIGEKGADDERFIKKVKPAHPTRKPILRVENLKYGNVVNNISFSVYPGEVTGIAGLIGSGRSETAKMIFGEFRRNFGGGRIRFKDRDIRYRRPSEAVRDGIAYVTEDRQMDGFFETMSATQNISLGWIAKHPRRNWLLKARTMKALAKEWFEKLSIRMIGEDQKVLRLSGGNQQKVVIAKSLIQDPSLIIFDEPTRGVDVGAITEIRKLIREIADGGAGVVVISSYLPEILEVSDRILVARGGTIVAEFSREEASSEKILHAAIH